MIQAALLLLLCLLELRCSADIVCDLHGGTFDFVFGEWAVSVLKDGTLSMAQEGFFSVPTIVAEAAFRRFEPSRPFIAPINVVLLRRCKQIVLIDSGNGFSGAPDSGFLLRRFEEIGVLPGAITNVLVSHFHGDHIKGLLDVKGRAVFPNATLHVGRIEHDFWISSLDEIVRRSGPVPNQLLKNTRLNYKNVRQVYSKRLILFERNESPLPGIDSVFAPGHTPGHTCYRIYSNQRSLFISADLFMTRTTTVRHPRWNLFSEAFREAAVKTRFTLMEQLTTAGELILSTHAAFPGLGFLTQSGIAFDWIDAPDIVKNAESGTPRQ